MACRAAGRGGAGEDGASAYLYIGYASSSAGAGFSLSPGEGLTYVALLATSTEIATPTADDFEGLWTLRGDELTLERLPQRMLCLRTDQV